MATLESASHDEKDMKRMPGWLVDLGDGKTQQILDEYNAHVDAAKKLLVEFRALVAQSSTPADEYGRAIDVLTDAALVLAKYRKQAMRSIPKWVARTQKLEKLKTKVGPAHKDFEKHAKSIGVLNSLIAEVQSFDRRAVGLDALIKQLPALAALPAAPQTASSMSALLHDIVELLLRGLELGHAPASKALAFINTSLLDVSSSSVSSLFFTPDELKTWQVREMAHRVICESYAKGKRVVSIAADKAFAAANHWCMLGYPKTRTAALREVEYFQKLLRDKTGTVKVSVKHWPRTDDLRQVAESLLRDPDAIASGIKREDWMDNPHESMTRERWRDFLLRWDVESTGIHFIGIQELCANAGLDQSTIVRDVPLTSIIKNGRKVLAESAGLATSSEELSSKEYKNRLLSGGISKGSVPFRDLALAAKRKHPQVRMALHGYLDALYRDFGRDFGAAFSYPEYITVAPGVTLPLLLFWDQPHKLKNARMACAHAWVRARAAAAAAPPHAPVPADHADADADDNDGEADGERIELFDDEEVDGLAPDDTAGQVDGLAQPALASGNLAYKIAVAAEAIRSVPGQKLIHNETLVPSADPQNVMIAEKLFSLGTAAEMDRLGHKEAAAFTRHLASAFVATDKRGYSPVARWDVWKAEDAAIEELHESLRWEPSSPIWVSPKTAMIEGFSRVLLECELVSNDSSRYLDIMLGPKGCKLINDRQAKGSDSCECFFSMCVSKMRQDKVTKFQWLKFMGPIIRMARRRVMDTADRRSPLNTQQKHVYQRSDFVEGFRCCCCSPPCEIGGRVNKACACADDGRHAKEDEKRVLRGTVHAEQSTRNKLHKA